MPGTVYTINRAPKNRRGATLHCKPCSHTVSVNSGALRAGALLSLLTNRRTRAASICLVAGTRLRISMAAGTRARAWAPGRISAAGTGATAVILAVTGSGRYHH